jgi:hypothetical protein
MALVSLDDESHEVILIIHSSDISSLKILSSNSVFKLAFQLIGFNVYFNLNFNYQDLIIYQSFYKNPLHILHGLCID